MFKLYSKRVIKLILVNIGTRWLKMHSQANPIVFIFSLERLYQDDKIHDLTSWQEFVS